MEIKDILTYLLTGRKSTVEDFSDPLLNPKFIILLNDDQIYVIPVNKKSSDIYHHYFILLFVDKDGILFTTFAASIETTLLFFIQSLAKARCYATGYATVNPDSNFLGIL